MNDAGFIVLWRKMITSWVWCLSDADFRLAVTCVCMANWKPGKWFDGREMVAVPRGSFVTSVDKLKAELGKEATSKKIRNGLSRLERAEFLKTGKGTGKRYTQITILNYSRYQDNSDETGESSGKEWANGGQTVGNERATIEQGNKGTKKTRGSQFPKNWKPTAGHIVCAHESYIDIADAAAAFRDHHTAKGSVMKNWDAAFNTWLRNAKKFQDRDNAKQPSLPQEKML